jgi:urease accessory protein
VAFGLALPRGTVLHGGDLLVLEPARLVVSIVERPEAVCVIEPRTPQEWGLFAYQIGNGHQPLMMTERALVCPDTVGVPELLDYHRIAYVRLTIPFTPIGGAAPHAH